MSAAAALLALSLAAAPAALAQVGSVAASIVPQFPSTVTVGAQDVPVSLAMENQSTGQYADDSFVVDEISLAPSCGSKLGFGACPIAGYDPGVFVPSATGIGRAGTACAGMAFAITLVDAAEGRYLFIPPGPPVILGPVATPTARCTIDLTVDVARQPNLDSDPAQVLPGPLQTDQYALVRMTEQLSGQTGTGVGTDETTVLQATAQISTLVSDATLTVGQSFMDTATLTAPAGAPTPTGTVDFFVYGPGDTTCAGPPFAVSLNRPLNAAGVATSSSFTPLATGTYRVVAGYSGDANYTPVAGACNDPNEVVVVAQGDAAISTQVSDGSITVGQAFTDTAVLTVTPGGPAPTGTVDFFVYGPGDTTCSGAPVAVSLARALGAAGTATSGTFVPATSGVYRVIARYSGDANYAPVSGLCGDANETVVVSQASPSIATSVSDASIIVGESFTDTATLTVPSGAPAPTGTVDFILYGPGDPTCTGVPVATSLNRPAGAGGTATSSSFTPPSAGTYRVIAGYSGDVNYGPVSGLCGDPGETVVVSSAPSPPPPPPLPTSKDQCKKGGWEAFGIFKNQGDCVSFVATGGKNPPAGPGA